MRDLIGNLLNDNGDPGWLL